MNEAEIEERLKAKARDLYVALYRLVTGVEQGCLDGYVRQYVEGLEEASALLDILPENEAYETVVKTLEKA